MTLLLLLACETTPPEPPPVPEEAPKPRVSLHSVGGGAGTIAKEPAAPEAVAGAATHDPNSLCQVDIDMRKVRHDGSFKADGIEGEWGRLSTEPLVMKDPSRGCPILAPAKLTLTVPAELGCKEAEIELNVGCGGQCAHAKSLKGTRALQEWTNSVNKHEDLVLAGPMDSIELWGEGLEICRIQIR